MPSHWLSALTMIFCLALTAHAQTLSPTAVPFAKTVVQTTSSAKLVTLTNTQTVALTISSISVTGDFAQTGGCPKAPNKLAAGASCKIWVTFTPTALGTRSGVLTVIDNASNSPQKAQLSGVGVLPATLSVSALNFGNQFVKTTSLVKSVTLTNNQTLPLTITGISASGDFAQTSTCPFSPNTLAAKSSCTISVTFTPTTTGTRTGTLTVNDGTSNSPQTAQLSGLGVAPVLQSSSHLIFATQPVFTTSAAQTVNLKNNQSVALTISSIVASGDFAASSNCPVSPNTLAAGLTCQISATFTPSVSGTRTGTITVTDNASTTPQTVGLSGTGSLAGLVSIAVAPLNPTVPAGSQQQLVASGMWSGGQTLDMSGIATWSSSAPAVATVSATGFMQAATQGVSTISATYGSVTGSTTVTVTAPTLTSITLTPTNPSVSLGATRQFVARGQYSDGSTQDLTSSSTWSSTVPSVATVSASGLVSAATAGTTTIAATFNSVSGSTTVTVSPPVCVAPPSGLLGWWTGDANVVDIGGNNSGTLQNAATYANGEVGQAFSFGGNGDSVLVNSPVYSPTAGTLMFWFMATGAGTLTGSYDGTNRTPGLSIDPSGDLNWEFGNLSGQFVAQVNLNQWYHVALTYSAPAPDVTISVYLNGNLVTSGIASANSSWYQQVAFGAYLGAQAPSFAGSIDEIAIFNQALSASQVEQLYNAVGAGMCKPTLQSIAINPANSSLAPGLSQQFDAVGSYSDNTNHDLTTSATWSSSNPAAATIDGSGLATAVAIGTTSVSAVLGGGTGSTNLTVAPSLVSIQVSPQNPSYAAGTTQPFTAMGTFSDGSTQDVTASVTWTSSTPSVATITSGGVASCIVTGQSTITAAAGSVNSFTLLTVTPATLVAITINPANPTVAIGQNQQFAATGQYSDGSTQNLTISVSWSSSTPSVAGISTTGLASALSGGSTLINASLGTISTSATFTVSSVALVSIAVTPANPSIALGTDEQFSATGTYADSSKLDLTSSGVWNSSAPSVATTSPSGMVASVSLGQTTITATAAGITGSSILTVTPPALVSVAITTASATIPPGTTERLAATGTFTNGSTQDVTSDAHWSSSVPSVATVSNISGSNGVVTSLGIGSTVVGATVGSLSGSSNLTVANPAQLQPTFFAISSNVPSDAPKVSYGVMGHPGPFAWTLVEQSGRGKYSWGALDQTVQQAPKDSRGVALMEITLGLTPPWALANQVSCRVGTQLTVCTDPPDNIQDWIDFVTALVAHYNGINGPHVAYYELWNETNSIASWTGSIAAMVALGQAAYPILKSDPYSVVITPSVTWHGSGKTGTAGVTWMTSYLQSGGPGDVISFHGYTSATGTNSIRPIPLPESSASTNAPIQTMITGMQAVAGTRPLAITEGGWGVTGVSDPDMQAAWLAHYYLLAGGYQASANLLFSDWYAWGKNPPTLSGVIENADGTPTQAGMAYSTVYQWLVGQQLGVCSVSGTIWSCPVGVNLVVWDDAQSCSNGVCTTAPFPASGYSGSYDLSGIYRAVSGAVNLGVKPILLVH